MQSGGLGKGLSALIPQKIKKDLSSPKKPRGRNSKSNPKDSGAVLEIELDKIISNANQPRKNFSKEELDSLKESVKQHGLLQPIIVIDKGNDIYEIVAGERRYLASRAAGLKKIPAILKEADDLAKLELALVENIQRQDLNPIEEAQAYQKLIKEFKLSQEDISQRVKKGRSSISNLLRYLRLPQEVQQGIIDNKINEGHAKVISALDDPEAQLALFKKTVKDNLTVRNVENIAQEINVRSHKRRKRPYNPLINQREKILSDSLGLKVKIKPGKKGGKILIEYFSENDLDRLIQILGEEI